MRLVVFGNGYSGQAIALAACQAGAEVTVTSRSGSDTPGVVDFASLQTDGFTHVVVTAPPGEDGDPVLATHGAALAASANLRWVGYLSTTGVYGDRGGAWVDEHTAPAAGQERSRRRLAAERQWETLAGRVAVDLFRTAGIYGPGRSALDDIRSGRARRVSRPGHEFGRIHRDDIAAAVVAAAMQDRPPGVRVLHLSDDEPAEGAAVTAEAARLLGVPPPKLVPYSEAEAGMSEMARSFWAENRKVSSAWTQQALGLRWRYPSYRQGLAAILAEQGGDRPAQ
jgi:nucleoside-diphosphate-sugar epimerase